MMSDKRYTYRVDQPARIFQCRHGTVYQVYDYDIPICVCANGRVAEKIAAALNEREEIE